MNTNVLSPLRRKRVWTLRHHRPRAKRPTRKQLNKRLLLKMHPSPKVVESEVQRGALLAEPRSELSRTTKPVKVRGPGRLLVPCEVAPRSGRLTRPTSRKPHSRQPRLNSNRN